MAISKITLPDETTHAIVDSRLPSVDSSDTDTVLTVVSGSWAIKRALTVHVGTTEPSASLGNNGDIYIMTESSGVLVSWDTATLYACSKINGYIDNSTNVWKTSSTYQGMLIDVRGLQGCTIRFSRSSYWTAVRYAFLRSFDNAQITNNQSIDFSQVSGYTAQINNSTDDEFDESIPSDATYLYVYTKSDTIITAPGITISGTAPSQKITNLTAPLFTANKTIGTDGTIYTGSSAPNNWCTTTQMALADVAHLWQSSFIVNSVPDGFDVLRVGIGLYSASKQWIRRLDYETIPAEISLSPDVCFVHLSMYGRYSGGDAVPISTVPIDGDDVQVVGTVV